MTSSEWQEIERLYLEASQLDPGDRSRFLDESCQASLRPEVESLLAADLNRGHFLDTPPASLAADLLARDRGTVLAGQLISAYEVRSLLSLGGMGEVYLTYDTRLQRPAVLKLLRRHLTLNAHAAQRFEREARAASSLQHPNIITIYEYGHSDAGMFIAMEWVDGQTWREIFDAGLVSLPDATAWSRQAAAAVCAAHEAGVVHRDIKPDNIMLRKDGAVKVLDFGLARLEEFDLPDISAHGSSGTISGTLSGTLSYMSPEVLRGETASSASDIFSLGSVFYELFTGHHPFAGDTPLDVFEAIECRTPELPGSLRRGLPEQLNGLVLAMLDRDPQSRPAAGDLVRRIEAIPWDRGSS